MNTAELRQLTPIELASRRDTLRAELAETRGAVRTGKEKNHTKLKQLRRDIARVETLLQEAAKA